MQLRAAEDRINQLEAEVELLRDRAVRAERWLLTIQKEIEEKLIAPRSGNATEQTPLPKDAEPGQVLKPQGTGRPRREASGGAASRFGNSLKRNGYRVRLASITLAAALGAGSIPCASQDGERPSVRNVSPPKVIRTHRPRIADDFFKQEAVHFERARIDISGSILADGHNVNLYGAVLVRRDKICTTAEGARWAGGQRAFIALRNLLEGRSITCRFKHVTVPPKAVCWVGDSDVTHLLLSQGWAELADEVTEASYVEALASAQSKKAGIWGDGPP
jgi:endonuclease YncB( thermonuclease family)